MFLLTLFECGSSARETRNVSVWWQNILDCVSDFSYTRRACECARHESRPAHSGQIGISLSQALSKLRFKILNFHGALLAKDNFRHPSLFLVNVDRNVPSSNQPAMN